MDGHITARRAAEHREREPWIDRFHALRHECVGLLLGVRHPAQCRPHLDGDTLRIRRGGVQVSVLQGLRGRGQREVREAIESPSIRAVHVVRGLEVVYLRSDPRAERRGIEARDRSNGRILATESVPKAVDAHPRRGDGSDSRDDDAGCSGVWVGSH